MPPTRSCPDHLNGSPKELWTPLLHNKWHTDPEWEPDERSQASSQDNWAVFYSLKNRQETVNRKKHTDIGQIDGSIVLCILLAWLKFTCPMRGKCHCKKIKTKKKKRYSNIFIPWRVRSRMKTSTQWDVLMRMNYFQVACYSLHKSPEPHPVENLCDILDGWFEYILRIIGVHVSITLPSRLQVDHAGLTPY